MKTESQSIRRIETTIETVTVYREGALVRRTGRIPAGEYAAGDSLGITGLPLSLRDESVRAGIASESGGLKLADVATILEVPAPKEEGNPPTDEELKTARRAVGRLQVELGELKQTLERIESTVWPERPVPKKGTEGIPSPTEGRLAFAEYLERRRKALLELRRDLKRRLAEAGRTLEYLQNREEQASTDRRNRLNEVRKTFVLDTTGSPAAEKDVCVFVEYLVPGAHWFPAYGLSFTGNFSSASLTTRALIGQRTGEDWRNVKISLSTALPEAWTDLPELSRRIIGRAVRRPAVTGWRAPPAGSDRLYADYEKFMSSRSRPLFEPPAEKTSMEAEADWTEDETEDYEEAPFGAAEEVEAYRSKSAEIAFDEQAAPAPSRAPMTAKKMARRSEAPTAELLAASLIPGAAGGPADGGPPAGGEPGGDLLDYASLRITAPGTDFRTALKRLSRRERYTEMLSETASGFDSAVLERIENAERNAIEVGGSAIPPGCRYPEPVDGFDYTYAADAPVTVESDGRYHTIPVHSRTLKPSIRYVAVPRLDTTAYVVAEMVNEGKAPLLPGPVDVDIDGDFLITAEIGTVPAGAPTELGLGAEEGISIARNARFEERTSGLTGGTRTLHHEIAVDIINNLPRTVELEVRERIPVHSSDRDKSDEKIKITVTATPEWEAFDQEEDPIRGGCRWKTALGAGEKTQLLAEYDIQLPSGSEIPGGNNREAE